MTGDGKALYATRHPLNITEEMRNAGAAVLCHLLSYDTAMALTERVFTAMCDASPPAPEDISDDALETVELDITLHQAIQELMETERARCCNIVGRLQEEIASFAIDTGPQTVSSAYAVVMTLVETAFKKMALGEGSHNNNPTIAKTP